jgi:hypothetical protein
MIPNQTGIYLTNDILNKYIIPLALSVLTFYQPIIVFLALAAGLTLADCYFAWRLSVRVKKLNKKARASSHLPRYVGRQVICLRQCF